MGKFHFEELTWQQVKSQIFAADKKLAEMIEAIKPDNSYSFVKVRYRYGDFILKKGELHLPHNEGTLPISSPQVPNELKTKLSYSSVPVGLVLNKSVEVFFETEDRCMPSKLCPTGTVLGLWEAFDPTPSEFIKRVWNLTAGARTTFFLPKVSDAISHGRLKKDLGLHTQAPKTLLDQYHVFSELAKKVDNDWYCDILFFTRQWLEDKPDNIACVNLHKHWLTQAWYQSYNCRSQMSYDVAWEEFSKKLSRKNYKPRASSMNVIKHLLTIHEGIFPGFTPALADESALPVKMIQKAYMEHYHLKKYAPIIMHPHHLRNKNDSIYYSLALPTQLEYFTQASGAPSILSDLRELKQLMAILQEGMSKKISSYQFFHPDEDSIHGIKPAAAIAQEDERIKQYLEEYPETVFCENSQFWKGCIRIDLNDN